MRQRVGCTHAWCGCGVRAQRPGPPLELVETACGAGVRVRARPLSSGSMRVRVCGWLGACVHARARAFTGVRVCPRAVDVPGAARRLPRGVRGGGGLARGLPGAAAVGARAAERAMCMGPRARALATARAAPAHVAACAGDGRSRSAAASWSVSTVSSSSTRPRAVRMCACYCPFHAGCPLLLCSVLSLFLFVLLSRSRSPASSGSWQQAICRAS